MSLPRAHFRRNLDIFGVSRGDSTLLKPASLACPGRDSNPHEENPHRILSPQRANPKYLQLLYLSISCVSSILAGVGWNGVVWVGAVTKWLQLHLNLPAELVPKEARQFGFDGIVYPSVRAPQDVTMPDWNLVMFSPVKLRAGIPPNT